MLKLSWLKGHNKPVKASQLCAVQAPAARHQIPDMGLGHISDTYHFVPGKQRCGKERQCRVLRSTDVHMA